MVPFYTFYSMFGFQRVGDLIWQAADSRARGFLLGATAGRTTLLGEGLQHQDGHSLVLASTVPAVQAYDPAFAYEVAAIVAGRPAPHVRRRPTASPTSSTTSTLYNENYPMPAQPDDPDLVDGIMRGLYRHAAGTRRRASRRRCCSAARRSAPPRQPPTRCATATTSASSCGRPRRTRRCARTRSRSSGGTACTRRSPPARRWSPRCSPDRRARSSPSPTS